MTRKVKTRLFKTLGLLIPSAAVAGAVSATVDNTPTQDANDPNTIPTTAQDTNKAFSLLGQTEESVKRIKTTETSAEDRTNTEYQFDSGLKSQLLIPQTQALESSQNTASIGKSEAFLAEEKSILGIVNSLLGAGTDIGELVTVVVAFRADYEDSFNVDTESWASVIGERIPTLPLEPLVFARHVTRIYRHIRNSLRVVQRAAGIPSAFSLAKYIFDYAFETVRLYPKVDPTDGAFKRRIGATYEAATKEIYVEWKAKSFLDEVDFSINRYKPIDKKALTELIDQRVTEDINIRVSEKAAQDIDIPSIAESDSVSLGSEKNLGEWFGASEKQAYEYIEKHKPYNKQAGVFVDPRRKPNSIGDFITKNNIIQKMDDSGTKVYHELLNFINTSITDPNIRRISALENSLVSANTAVEIADIKRKYRIQAKETRQLQKLTDAERATKLEKISLERASKLKEVHKKIGGKVRKLDLSIDEIAARMTKLKTSLPTILDIDLTNKTLKELSNNQTLAQVKKNLNDFSKKIERLGVKKVAAVAEPQTLDKQGRSKTELGQFKSAEEVAEGRRTEAEVYRLQNTPNAELTKLEIAQKKASKAKVGARNTRIPVNKITGRDTTILTTHEFKNRISNADFDKLNKSLDKVYFTGQEVDEAQKALRTKGLSRKNSMARLDLQLQASGTQYKTEIGKQLAFAKNKLIELQSLQDLYERAMRRDTIFNIYHEIKRALSANVVNSDEVKALLQKIAGIQDEVKDTKTIQEGGDVLGGVDNSGNKRFDYTVDPGKKVKALGAEDTVDGVLKKSAKLESLKLDGASVINTKDLHNLSETLENTVRRSKALIESVPSILQVYQNGMQTMIADLDYLVVEYQDYVREIKQKYTDPNSLNLALNELDDAFLARVKDNSSLNILFDNFYGGTRIEDMVSFEEFEIGYKKVLENANVQIDDINKAGQKLADFFNTQISPKAKIALEKNELLSKLLADSDAIEYVEGTGLINVEKSDPRLLNYIQDSYDSALDLDDYIKRFDSAATNGLQRPINEALSYGNISLINNANEKNTLIFNQNKVSNGIAEERKALTDIKKSIVVEGFDTSVLRTDGFQNIDSLKTWTDFHVGKLQSDFERLRGQAKNVTRKLEQRLVEVNNLIDEFKANTSTNKKRIYIGDDSPLSEIINTKIDKQLSAIPKADWTPAEVDLAGAKSAKFYSIETVESLKADVTVRIETLKKYELGGDDLFDRTINDIKAIKKNLEDSVDATKPFVSQSVTGKQLIEANTAYGRAAKNWDHLKENIFIADGLIDDYNEFILELQKDGLTNGKGAVYKTSFASESTKIDIKDFKKASVLNEKARITTEQDLRAKSRVTAVQDTVDGLADNSKLKNTLADLTKLDAQVETFKDSASDVFKWGQANLQQLQKRRAIEVLKYNAEVLSAAPDTKVITQLAAVINSMDEQVIERTATLMRALGEDAADIKTKLDKQKALLDTAVIQDTTDTLKKINEPINVVEETTDTGRLLAPTLEDLRASTSAAKTPAEESKAIQEFKESWDKYREANRKADAAKLPVNANTHTIANIEDVKFVGGKASVLTKYEAQAQVVRNQIDEYKKALLSATNTPESAAKIAEARKILASEIEAFQKTTGELTGGTVGTFGDVKDYQNSVWYSSGTDAAGKNLDDATDSAKDAFKQLQTRYATIENMSDSFQDALRTADSFAVQLFDESSNGRKIVQQVVDKKIINTVQTGLDSAEKIVKTTKIAANAVKKVSKARAVLNFANKISGFTEYLDPVGFVVEKAIQGTFYIGGKLSKQISKVAAKISSKYTSVGKKVENMYGALDSTIDIFDTMLSTKKQLKAWQEAAEQSSKQINKLTKQIEDAGDSVDDLRKALDSQKDLLSKLNSKIDDAASAAQKATDAFDNAVTRNVDTTIDSLKNQLKNLDNIQDGLSSSEEALKIQKKIDTLTDFKVATAGDDAATQLKKLKNLNIDDLASNVASIAKKQSASAVKQALSKVDEAEDALKASYAAFDKAKDAFKTAKKAGKLSDNVVDSMSTFKDAIRFAETSADAAKQALLFARLKHADNFKYIKYIKRVSAFVKHAFKGVSSAIKATKVAAIVGKVVKIVMKGVKLASKVIGMIPFIGDAIELIMIGVSIYFAVERQKAHDKTAKWNKEAKDWKLKLEMNPWGVPKTKEYDKYHPWAVGALPALLNLGYSEDLSFTKQIKDPLKHPFFSCEGGENVPGGEFTYPLISKDYVTDYNNYFSKDEFTNIEVDDWSSYLDLIDPVAIIGNNYTSGNFLVEEVKNELWLETEGQYLSLEHKIVTGEMATRKEQAYTYPVVNKDCYFFVGKYAPLKDKDSGVSYSDRQGLYNVSSITKSNLLDDGADAETINKLRDKQKDTYVYSELSGDKFLSLREAVDLFQRNNTGGFIVKAKQIVSLEEAKILVSKQEIGTVKVEGFINNKKRYYRNVYTVVKNYDPTKNTVDNLESYRLAEEGEEGYENTLEVKKISEYTLDELLSAALDSEKTEKSTEFENVTYTGYFGGILKKNVANLSFNGMEEAGTNPSIHRSFRYIYTTKGQAYIEKKTEEILAYNVEQIAKTLIDVREKVLIHLSVNERFVTQLSRVLSGGSNERLTPVGVRTFLSTADSKGVIKLLSEHDWDLHLNDFTYWQIKDVLETKNRVNTTFTNRALLDDKHSSAHPWAALVEQNVDQLLSSLSSKFYSAGKDTRLINLISDSNRGISTILNASMDIVVAASAASEQVDNQRTVDKMNAYVRNTFATEPNAANLKGVDPMGFIQNTMAYTIDKLNILFRGAVDDPKFDETLEIIFSERFRYLVNDLKPNTSIFNKIAEAKSVKEVDDLLATYIKNASEREQETNFFQIAQIWRQSFNWSREADDGMYRSRLDFVDEAVRNFALSKVNKTNDGELINNIKAKFVDKNLTFSELQLTSLYINVDPSRSYVTEWIKDYGILSTADDFIKAMNNAADINKLSPNVAEDYMKRERLNHSGAESTEVNKWSDISVATQNQNGLIKASPGATRVKQIVEFYTTDVTNTLLKDDLSASDLKSIFKKFKTFYEDTIEDAALSQVQQRDAYIDRIIEVAFGVLEDIPGEDESTVLFFDKGSDDYNKLKKEIIDEIKSEWIDEARAQLTGSGNNPLSSFFSRNSGEANTSNLSAYFYTTSEAELRELFQGRDVRAITRRVGYFDYLPDYLAKVFDLGRTFPNLIRKIQSLKSDNLESALSDAPIVAPYALIIQKIQDKAIGNIQASIERILNDSDLSLIYQNEDITGTLINNISLKSEQKSSDFVQGIELSYPNNEGSFVLKNIGELNSSNFLVRTWIERWDRQIVINNGNRPAILTSALTEATEDAALQLSKQVASDSEAYKVVAKTDVNLTYTTNEAIELLKYAHKKGIYTPENIKQPTENDLKFVNSFLYIDENVDVSKATQVVNGGTIPNILINDEFLVTDYDELVKRLPEATNAMKNYMIKQLDALGITIVTKDQSLAIDKKSDKRIVLIENNQYIDLTYVPFINKYRENALEQNDKINKVIDDMAKEEMKLYRDKLNEKDENKANTDLLYFKKSDLSKIAIEYIWIDLSNRDVTEFKKQLKKFIINFTGRNVISDRIVNLTEWEETQDAWSNKLIQSIKDKDIDSDKEFFTRENKTSYVLNTLKPLLRKYMETVYQLLEDDMKDFSSFKFNGIESFTSVVENLGKINNEFNNLLPKKLLSMFGLELSLESMTALQEALPMFFDTQQDLSLLEVLSTELKRDLSPVPAMKDYTKATNGDIIITAEEESEYVSNLDAIFKTYIDAEFRTYLQTNALYRYGKVDRNNIYKSLLKLVESAYQSEIRDRMRANNHDNILSGQIFEEAMKKTITRNYLLKLFTDNITEIDPSIVEDGAADADWQNYIIEEIVKKHVKSQVLSPTKEGTLWEFQDVSLPSINLALNLGIDSAIEAYNDAQVADAQGKAYRIVKSKIPNEDAITIATDLIESSLNRFAELLEKATKEKDKTILPEASEYAYTIINQLYTDITTPTSWTKPFDKYRVKSLSTQSILSLNDFRQGNSLGDDATTAIEYDTLIALQRILFQAPGALTKDEILTLYLEYTEYLRKTGYVPGSG